MPNITCSLCHHILGMTDKLQSFKGYTTDDQKLRPQRGKRNLALSEKPRFMKIQTQSPWNKKSISL